VKAPFFRKAKEGAERLVRSRHATNALADYENRHAAACFVCDRRTNTSREAGAE